MRLPLEEVTTDHAAASAEGVEGTDGTPTLDPTHNHLSSVVSFGFSLFTIKK